MLKLSDLSWQQALAIALSVYVAWFVTTTYLQYRQLAHVKGPLLAALTPFWLFYHTLKGDVCIACHKEFEKHGSPIRIKPNWIVSNDPASIKLAAERGSPWHRGSWYDGMKLDPKIDNILSMRDEADHATRRKQLVPGYTMIDVPSVEADVDARVLELKALISQYAEKDQPFDMARLIIFFALDVLCKIAFGEPLGYMTKNEDIFDYVKQSAAFFPILELGINHKGVLNILQHPLLASAQPKHTDKTGFGAMLGHANKIIKERFASGTKHDDVLGSFIKNGLTPTELESEALILILAGTDSTSTGLRITLLYIMTNPMVYTKLRKEIDAAEVGPVISNTKAQTLPYLKAVVLEGLRMFMPLTGLVSRVPPKGGMIIEGTFVPESCEIGFQVYSMLRRRDIFGQDADTFRPERWLEGDAESIRNMERCHSLIFGSGRTSCLGRNVAMMEIRKVVFEVSSSTSMLRRC